MKFIDEIEKELNYPFKGIISDIQENIAYSLVSKKLKIPPQFCKTHILRVIDRVLKTLAYHNQLSKLLKRLRSLKSVFIHQASYRLKKQKQV